MASTRYGRIYHSQNHYNNIKFPSSAARDTFAQEFEKYHNSHEHDGDVPRFEMIKAVKIKSYERQAQDANDVTMDGYSWAEIHKYHNREFPDTHTHYRVPTCCLSPIIVLDREFIDSGTLQRHELSSIFGDMPEDDFENLVKSVKSDGFMDSLIRMHEGQILDGWHRYSAACELNLVRKLMFMNWDEKKEGTAAAFVAARNLERRHLSISQRAQIAVTFNKRFGWGGDRSKGPKEPLNTQDDLATRAKVSKSSIKRAVQVEKAGQSEEVMSGEKSATQVIKEVTLNEMWEKVSAEMPKWKQRYKESGKKESKLVSRASKSMLISALRAHRETDDTNTATVEELKDLLDLMKRDSYPLVYKLRAAFKETDENPYTDTFIYPDDKLIDTLIPDFKAFLESEQEHIRENAAEKLELIRHELIRRRHRVDEDINVERKSPDPEPETPEPEAEPAEATPPGD